MATGQRLPSDEDEVIRRRRQGIYALTGFCAVFFGGGMIITYVLAARYGYGTGFGDGHLLPAGTGDVRSGHGFLGDAAILFGTFVIDALLLGAWCWLITRLDSVSADDPLAPDDGGDLTRNESWYYVRVPVLTKVIMGIAVACIVGLSVGAAAILPLALLRYGWS
ncbi:hypothetical protein [Mycobacterium sp. 94-17]|uniref:hypothetical protein n=1 Tax=Mycobacterium sp. 94-17 TaxID=2986147 RepID=UPI002D1ED8D6|nr:hypothetical protein [Mycobacterium sp. 94-17]MEB4212161.1 hypothetical protein [Mycobacterium sp. 94-17]